MANHNNNNYTYRNTFVIDIVTCLLINVGQIIVVYLYPCYYYVMFETYKTYIAVVCEMLYLCKLLMVEMCHLKQYAVFFNQYYYYLR